MRILIATVVGIIAWMTFCHFVSTPFYQVLALGVIATAGAIFIMKGIEKTALEKLNAAREEIRLKKYQEVRCSVCGGLMHFGLTHECPW